MNSYVTSSISLISVDLITGQSCSVFKIFVVVPKAKKKKARSYRERAPWEKPEVDSDDSGNGNDFAEEDYLAGRIALVDRTSGDVNRLESSDRFARIPSKAFNKLRRSVSRDDSPDDQISRGIRKK